MDFFGAQHQARRRTGQFAALFGVAVACLVLLTNLLVALVYTWSVGLGPAVGLDPARLLATLPAGYWFWISLGVIAVTAIASLHKYHQLRGGGRAVAEALGATRVHPDSRDPAERRLLNVVEEMAIASGVPVPPVYRLPETSINAFAAGSSPQDAVIGVNQGTLDHLTREELQGVVAHEFSHILNGDIRLNLRLVAVLHGILFIGLVGRGILQGVNRGALVRSERRRGPVSTGLPVLALGVGLTVIGYTGTFFGNLIKAAVSRQREYLADAAAVQFTRNPHSIAGALKKIGAHAHGSTVGGAAAGEASHMFFGQVGPLFLNRLMATHPPLPTRIRQIDPRWNGRFPTPPPITVAAAATDTVAPTRSSAPGTIAAAAEGLAQAARLIGGLPSSLRDAAHDPWSARGLAYALVTHDGAALEATVAELQRHGEGALAAATLRLVEQLAPVDARGRVALIELALPALKALSDAQYRRFMVTLVSLVKQDQRIDLMEWVLHRVLVRDLKPHFEGPPRARRHAPSAAAQQAAIRELLSALALEVAGADAPERALEAFSRGAALAQLAGAPEFVPDPDYTRLNAALGVLRGLPPLAMPRLIKACAATVRDGGVACDRARADALLHGIAATLDCPLPPPTQAPDESLFEVADRAR